MRIVRVEGVGGVDLMALTEVGWHELKEANPACHCPRCDGSVYLRRRQWERDDVWRVIQMGCHYAGLADACAEMFDKSYDESPEHAHLADLVGVGARRARCRVEFERGFAEARCRPDVFATSRRSGKKFVLEAQRSGITAPKVHERQAKYLKVADSATWFHTRDRDWSVRVPSMKVDDSVEWVIDGIVERGTEDAIAPIPVEDAVQGLIQGDLLYVSAAENSAYKRRRFGYFTPRSELRRDNRPVPDGVTEAAKHAPRRARKYTYRSAMALVCRPGHDIELTEGEVALIHAQIRTLREFRMLLRSGSDWIVRFGPDALSPKQHRALAIDREHPELKNQTEDHLAAVDLRFD